MLETVRRTFSYLLDQKRHPIAGPFDFREPLFGKTIFDIAFFNIKKKYRILARRESTETAWATRSKSCCAKLGLEVGKVTFLQ